MQKTTKTIKHRELLQDVVLKLVQGSKNRKKDLSADLWKSYKKTTHTRFSFYMNSVYEYSSLFRQINIKYSYYILKVNGLFDAY